MTKSIKRYFKDNLGIIAALAVMIIFLYKAIGIGIGDF